MLFSQVSFLRVLKGSPLKATNTTENEERSSISRSHSQDDTQLQRQMQGVLRVSTHLPIPRSTFPSQGFGHLALAPPTLPQDLCKGVQTAKPQMPVWLVAFKLPQRILFSLLQRQGQELLSNLTQCSQRKSRRHVWP